MIKIVINRCYGGFGLSQEALKRLIELGASVQIIKEAGWKDASNECMIWDVSNVHETPRIFEKETLVLSHGYENQIRTDPRLIQTIEELGERANGRCAELEIIEIPEGVEWEIEEYDGMEWVAEKHRTWS